MKTRRSGLFLCAVAYLATPLLRSEIAVGATRAEAIAELGEPRSRMILGDREVLAYDRVSVSLTDGRVAGLRFADQAPARKPAGPHAEATGNALGELTGSDEWKDASGAERVTMLLDFRREHPGADIAAPLKAAERRRDAEFAGAASALARQHAEAEAESRKIAAEEAARAAKPPATTEPAVTIVYGGYLISKHDRLIEECRRRLQRKDAPGNARTPAPASRTPVAPPAPKVAFPGTRPEKKNVRE